MSDTGSYSDVVVELLELLGISYRPALADLPDQNGWRINGGADYGPLNTFARGKIDLRKIRKHWEDILRVVASIYTGTVRAYDVVTMLQRDGHPTALGEAIASYGRIFKSLHILNFIDTKETYRRDIKHVRNLQEGRPALARKICHGKKGELYHRYERGLENQLGVLGLVLNCAVLWTTVYLDAALAQLRAQGYPVRFTGSPPPRPLRDPPQARRSGSALISPQVRDAAAGTAGGSRPPSERHRVCGSECGIAESALSRSRGARDALGPLLARRCALVPPKNPSRPAETPLFFIWSHGPERGAFTPSHDSYAFVGFFFGCGAPSSHGSGAVHRRSRHAEQVSDLLDGLLPRVIQLLRQRRLIRCQPRPTAADPATRACRGQAVYRVRHDQLTLQFGQNRQHPEHRSALHRRGVDALLEPRAGRSSAHRH